MPEIQPTQWELQRDNFIKYFVKDVDDKTFGEIKFLFRDLSDLDEAKTSNQSTNFCHYLDVNGYLGKYFDETLKRFALVPTMEAFLKKLDTSRDHFLNKGYKNLSPKFAFTKLLYVLAQSIDISRMKTYFSDKDIRLDAHCSSGSDAELIFQFFETLVEKKLISENNVQPLENFLIANNEVRLMKEEIHDYNENIVDNPQDAWLRRYDEKYFGFKTYFKDITLEQSIVYIHGLPGMGKTALAHKLCKEVSNKVNLDFRRIDLKEEYKENKPIDEKLFYNHVLKALGNFSDENELTLDVVLRHIKKQTDPSCGYKFKYVILIDNADFWEKCDYFKKFLEEIIVAGEGIFVQFIITSRLSCSLSESKFLKVVKMEKLCDDADCHEFINHYCTSNQESLSEKSTKKVSRSCFYRPLTMKFVAGQLSSDDQVDTMVDQLKESSDCDENIDETLSMLIRRVQGELEHERKQHLQNLLPDILQFCSVFPQSFSAKEISKIFNFEKFGNKTQMKLNEADVIECFHLLHKFNLLENLSGTRKEKVTSKNRFSLHLLLKDFVSGCYMYQDKTNYFLFCDKFVLFNINRMSKRSKIPNVCLKQPNPDVYYQYCKSFNREKANCVFSVDKLAAEVTNPHSDSQVLKHLGVMEHYDNFPVVLCAISFLDVFMSATEAERLFEDIYDRTKLAVLNNEQQHNLFLLFFASILSFFKIKYSIDGQNVIHVKEILDNISLYLNQFKSNFRMRSSVDFSVLLEVFQGDLLARLILLKKEKSCYGKAEKFISEGSKKFEQIISECEELRNCWLVAYCYNDFGNVLYKLGQLKNRKLEMVPKAETFYKKAVSCVSFDENTSDGKTYVLCKNSVTYLQNVANCYLDLDRFDDTQLWFDRAHTVVENSRYGVKLENSETKACLDYSRGIFFYRKGANDLYSPAFPSYDQSLTCLYDAARIYLELYGFHVRAAASLGMLAVVLFNNTRLEKHWDLSFKYFKYCLTVEESLFKNGSTENYTFDYLVDKLSNCLSMLNCKPGFESLNEWEELKKSYVELNGKRQEARDRQMQSKRIRISADHVALGNDTDQAKKENEKTVEMIQLLKKDFGEKIDYPEDHPITELFATCDKMLIKNASNVSSEVLPSSDDMRIVGTVLLRFLKTHKDLATFGIMDKVHGYTCCTVRVSTMLSFTLNALNEYPEMSIDDCGDLLRRLSEFYREFMRCRHFERIKKHVVNGEPLANDGNTDNSERTGCISL